MSKRETSKRYSLYAYDMSPELTAFYSTDEPKEVEICDKKGVWRVLKLPIYEEK